MKRSIVGGLTLCVISWLTLLVTSVAATPGADDYGAHPALRNVTIAPDGKHVAMVTTVGDIDAVSILTVGGNVCRLGQGKNKLRSVFWGNNERLFVVVSMTGKPSWGDSYYGTRVAEHYQTFSVSAQCEDVKPIKELDFVGRLADGRVLMTTLTCGSTRAQKNTRRYSEEACRLDLAAVDARSGAKDIWESADDLTVDWIVDTSGNARIRVDYDRTLQRRIVSARVGSSKDWTLVYDGRSVGSDDDQLIFDAIGPRPDTAYVLAYKGSDRRALYEFDLATRQLGRIVASNPRVDIGGVVLAAYTGAPVGVGYTDDASRVIYFDRAYQQMQADLQATFPGERVTIGSATKDTSKYIALVEGATNPGGAYYYVEAGSSIAQIGARYPAIKSSDVGSVRFFDYTARDGYKIPAYLTLPNGSTGKNLPLVVMPHGGPESRDFGGFDTWSQFLASRGYAVLQPQFRASAGFGLAHRNAGRKEWGMLVQDDITDGVNHLVNTGVADRSRICIVGWSFGGYASMAGLAFTPDLYRCGVAGAGVSDLSKMLAWIEDRRGRGQRSQDYFTDAIGYLTKDEKRLAATSPALHAAKFKAPLLLIHGKDDTVVPKEQSDIMADALKAAGKPFEYVVLEGEDHHLSRSSTSKEYFRQLERFLARHLK